MALTQIAAGMIGNLTTMSANTITSYGSVGVGAPATLSALQITGDDSAWGGGQLHVTGATNPNYRLRLGYNTTSNYGSIQAVNYGTAYTALALNPSGGNVGIGTSSPVSTLDVYSGNYPIFKSQELTVLGSPNLGTYAGYLLLARAYTSGYVGQSWVDGTFYLKRGSATSGNRTDVWTVSSNMAYNTEDLTVQITANASQFFVSTCKVTYGGVVYHAIQTNNNGGNPDNGVWFTGTYYNCSPIYVDATYVSNITSFGVSTILTSGGLMGFNTATPAVTLDLGANTDAIKLPTGNTAQRPAATAGMIRFNTSLKGIDYYDGSGWNNISVSDPYFSSTKVLIKNGSLTDASNAGRTLTNGGSASTSSSVGYPPITKGSSKTGNAGSVWYIDSNTSNAYVSFASPLSDFDLSQSAWTLEMWVYIPSGGSSYGHTFWCGGQTSQGEFKFNAGDQKMYLYSGVGQSVSESTGSTNAWNWIVFERYNGTISCWFNGANRQQGTTMPTGGTPSAAAIGYPFNAEYFGHYVDEVRFSTVARYQGAATITVQSTSWPEH